MANKQTIYTFHQVREKCPQGSPESWRAFFNLYGPLLTQLLGFYAAGDLTAWERTMDALTRDNFDRFRKMPQQSEREFLMELRAELLGQAAAALASQTPDRGPGRAKIGDPPAAAGGPASNLDLERVVKALAGSPLLHQTMMWFKLAGYTDVSIERMLRMTPTVAREALERVATEFGVAAAPAADRCPWPRPWLELLVRARAEKKEDCPEMHQLLRIHDGQVSWYDKEPVEKRVSSCAHCLDNWTGLREVAYWRQAAPAIPGERIEEWMRRVPVTEAKKKSFF